MSIRLIIKDEVNIKFENLPLPVRKKLAAEFKYDKPNAQYQPACKLGRWDGKVALFGIGGTGYIHQLERILTIFESLKITLDEVVDQRIPFTYTPTQITSTFWADRGKTWPVGHALAGQPIVLYDYQVDIVNRFLESPQSVQEVATGAGKCLAYHTPIDLITPNGRLTTPIGKFIEWIEDSEHTQLINNVEMSIAHLNYMANTPTGPTPIRHVIKKELPNGLIITLPQNIKIDCANHHLFLQNGLNVAASSLTIGSTVDTKNGPTVVLDIQPSDTTTYYDIGIDYPHLYYDANGIIHHNTITTATLAYIAEPHGRTIVIVPNKSLVEQTEEDFITVGLDVGVYFGDRKDLYKTHTICTWQSLNVLHKKSDNDPQLVVTLSKFLHNVTAVIVDECHTTRADVLRTLLTQHLGNASIRWGLTGTIPKEPYEYESLYASVGPLIGGIAAHELQEQGYLSNCHVHVLQTIDPYSFTSYAREIDYLSTSPERLSHLVSMINEVSENGNTLVLVNRIATGNMLKQLLSALSGVDVPFISSKISVKNRKTEYDEIKTSDNKNIIATYGVASVGLNIPRLFNLVLVDSGKGFIRVIQSIGRGLRRAHDKDHVNIYDITSTLKFSKRHLTIRKRFYKEAQYPFTIKKVDWQS